MEQPTNTTDTKGHSQITPEGKMQSPGLNFEPIEPSKKLSD